MESVYSIKQKTNLSFVVKNTFVFQQILNESVCRWPNSKTDFKREKERNIKHKN